MTIDELGEILDCYGIESVGWPLQKRATCLALLAESSEARTLLREHVQLEHLLDRVIVPSFPNLESHVLNQTLPLRIRPLTDRLLDWLIPANPLSTQFWRPALAACLPLVFGILVGNYFSFGVTTETQGFEYWDDELYLLSLNDYTENLF